MNKTAQPELNIKLLGAHQLFNPFLRLKRKIQNLLKKKKELFKPF